MYEASDDETRKQSKPQQKARRSKQGAASLHDEVRRCGSRAGHMELLLLNE